jgi:uncharacterized protein (TIGR02145 family)
LIFNMCSVFEKMRIRKLILFATLGIFNSLLCQTYPQPEGVYVGTAPFTEEIITQKLKNSGLSKPYDKAYWENMQLRINNHNKWVDNQVLKFKTDRSDMASIRQQMIGIQDINGLQQQLDDKRKSAQQIPVELQKSLEDVGYRGTFVCVIPRGSIFQTDVEELIGKAQNNIAAVAVPQLNGAFIKSVTTVENGLLQEKTIKQWVKGKMAVSGSPFYSQTSNKQDYYVFGASVEVSPLKTDIKTTNNNTVDNGTAVVLDMSLPEADIKSKLIAAGLHSDEADAIYKAYMESGFQAMGETYNRGKNILVQKLNREAKANEKKLNAEIIILEEQLKSHEHSVNDLLTLANLKVTAGSSKEKLEKLNVHITGKIRSLEDSIVQYLSRRYEQWDNPVILTNSYTQQMAQTALSGLTLLQARSAITGYVQFVEVQNGLVTEYTEGKEVEFNRELQELWLVPIGGQGDTYFMGMVARYRLKGKTDGVPTSGSTGSVIIEEVKIGTQTWMAKNLDVSTFRNGDVIPEAKTAEEWKAASEKGQPAWCYYDNNPENGKIYGKLYNWYAVNDLRGLAPKGWHIPTDGEWTSLTNYLGGSEIAGAKMKSKTGWGWYGNGNGTNSSGFNGLPGGNRGNDETFNYIGKDGYWWSSTEYNTDYAWNRNLYYNNGYVFRYSSNKKSGFSVRCLRD